MYESYKEVMDLVAAFHSAHNPVEKEGARMRMHRGGGSLSEKLRLLLEDTNQMRKMYKRRASILARSMQIPVLRHADATTSAKRQLAVRNLLTLEQNYGAQLKVRVDVACVCVFAWW